MRATRLAATLALLIGLVVSPAFSPSAHASCAEDSGALGSDIVFTGTMMEERRGFARFEVTNVWVGPDLAPEVWVLSGQEQARWPFFFLVGVSSSNDATLEIGEEYVIGASADFYTDDCSIGAGVDERPTDVRAPSADGLTGADPPLPGWLGIVGLLAFPAALIAIVGYVRRRRRR